MLLLHVVVVAGGGAWHTAITFWLLVTLIGGIFAWLCGDQRNPDALACDLGLALAGGAALNVASRPLGTDPLAGIYGVRLFWTVFGAALLLSLGHGAAPALHRFGLAVPITDRGGPAFLLLWLGGWPSERGLVEACYGAGLPLKLLPETLHYQTRRGPLPAVQAIVLRHIREAGADGDTLVIRRNAPAGTGSTEIRLEHIRPAGVAAALASEIARLQSSTPI
jgi:hypothetical protein